MNTEIVVKMHVALHEAMNVELVNQLTALLFFMVVKGVHSRRL